MSEQVQLLSWLPPSAATYIYTVLLKPKWIRSIAQSIIKLRIPKMISIFDVNLLLNKNDAVVSGALSLGCYEKGLLTKFREMLTPGMFVVDIGANIGLYTVISAQKVGPSGRVIAIEPEQTNCGFVEKSVALNNLHNVRVFNRALGDENKTIDLFLCDTNLADHRVYDNTGSRRKVQVQMSRLDDLLKEETPRAVDIIKMDVQGAEALALQGMKQTLVANPKVKLFMEYWPWGLLQAGSDPLSVLKFFRSIDYKISMFEDHTDVFVEVTDDEALSKHTLEREHFNLLISKEI